MVWAHCILGLTVLIQGSPDGDIAFGTSGTPQVIIKWAHDWKMDTYYQKVGDTTTPGIYLLDGDLHVLLKSEPSEHEGMEIEGQERHRLRGYGTTSLRRLLNMDSIIADDDPIYAEVVQFAIAFASVAEQSSYRLFEDPTRKDKDFSVAKQYYLRSENTRLIAASEILFSGIQFDRREVNDYVEKIQGVKKEDMALPPTVRHYTDKVARRGMTHAAAHFMNNVPALAALIIIFAHVVNVQTCASIPLIYDPEDLPAWTPICLWDGITPLSINSDDWLSSFLRILAGATTVAQTFHGTEDPFLISSRGWSCFYTVVGDIDPGNVNCELISLQRGIPTNQRTNERKCCISDAPRIYPKGKFWGPGLIDKGNSYVPRCISPVAKRTELYSTRAKGFWLSIRFDVVWLPAPSRSEPELNFSLYVSYKQLHEALWKTIKTEPCPHPGNDIKPVQLDLGVSTAKGFDWMQENEESLSQRILISLVKGDSRARWLVLAGTVKYEADLIRATGQMKRRVLLRCDGCCEDCAVKAASAMEGKWLVII